MRGEFDDKFSDLIQNLQNLAASEGGKNMAGMTALGTVLKNLKSTTSPKGNEKYEERLNSMDEYIVKHDSAINRMWKILQLKQSKNESSFLKNKVTTKKDSNKNLGKFRNFLSREYSQLDENNEGT